MRVRTQWRMSMAGRDSLDYTAVHTTFERLGLAVSLEEWDGIAVMEAVALKTWHAARQAQAAKR